MPGIVTKGSGSTFVQQNSGSGSGGGGGGNGTTSQISGVVDQAGGPTSTTSTWVVAALVGQSGLNYLQVAKNNLTSLGAAPDFSVNYGTGTITLLNGNTWSAGDTLVGYYTAA